MKRVLHIGLLLAFVAGACSTDADTAATGAAGTDTAVIDTSVNDTALNDTALSGTETVPATTLAPDGTSSWTYVEPADADDAARLALDALRNRLVEAGGCATSDPAGARQQFLAVVTLTATQPANDAWDALAAAEASCGSDEDLWAASLIKTLGHLGDVAVALGAEETQPPNTPTTDVAALAATVVTQYDHVHAVLNPAGPAQRAAHWFNPAESILLAELRALQAQDDPPTIVLTGDSVMKHGIDVATLRDAGINAYNAAIPAGAPPIQAKLMLDALPLTPTVDTIVWDVSTHWLFGSACRDSEIYAAAANARAAVFTGVAQAAGRDPFDLVLGPDLAAPIYSLAAPEEYGSLDPYGLGDTMTYGDGPVLSGTASNPPAVDQAARRYEGEPAVCQRAFEIIGNAIEAWAASAPGATIIVVRPPMSDDLAALHPGGREAHEEIAAELAAVVTANGATLVDLSDTVPQDGFHDMVHTNEVGRAIFTDAVIELLT